ncbi:MAG: hypothetical protein AB1641_20525 [Thermodesulfobacteriota bacterium]
MKLAVTIDVEEEGLFCGRYDSGPAAAENIRRLKLLEPIFQEWCIRPTLLVSYQAARRPADLDFLGALKEKWRAEIGGHLHPWNTPPLAELPDPEPVPSEKMPRELLSAKIDTLFAALKPLTGPPASFRMGRFNFGPKLLGLLEEKGLLVDSSVAPMREYPGGPAHLSAPTDPYFPDAARPLCPGGSRVLEVPVTILPLTPRLGLWLDKLGRGGIPPRRLLTGLGMYLGSLSAQPMGSAFEVMRAAVRRHRRRGGRVVTFYFHSSELVPGASPQVPTRGHVERFVQKIDRFISWLRLEMNAQPLTLAELYAWRGQVVLGKKAV